MRPTERKDISFSSASGRDRVAAYFYENPETEPFCIVQISHGMCEYLGRYAAFAHFLAQNGAVVCGNDHLGHGSTAATPDDYGHFGGQGGRRYVLEDLRTMNRLAREAYPGLPLILLGHSMGSFYARKYAADQPNEIDGLILSGTAGPNPMADIGIALARAIAKMKGDRYRSKAMDRLAFGGYLARIPNPRTRYDWVSHSEDVVRQYATDPKCNFRFTVNGFHELSSILKEVSSQAWAVSVRKDMPVLLFSGDEDPVGNYGKGVRQVYNWLHGAGVKNVELKLYPGGRHEMLNELQREEVYADVLAFLRRWFQNPKAETVAH